MSNNNTDLVDDSSVTDPKQALLQEKNENGIPITFACRYHVGDQLPWPTEQQQAEGGRGGDNDHDTASTMVTSLTHYYQLVFPCATETNIAIRYISEQLLLEAAVVWDILPNGDACVRQRMAYNNWLYGVSSGREPDMILPGVPCPTPVDGVDVDEDDNTCCRVVQSEMHFIPAWNRYYHQNNVDRDGLYQFLRNSIDQNRLVRSLPLRTISVNTTDLFADIDPNAGHSFTDADAGSNSSSTEKGIEDEVGPAPQVSGVLDDPSSSSKERSNNNENQEWTLVSILVLGLLLLAALAAVSVFLVVLRQRRRRRRRPTTKTKTADSTSDEESNNDEFPVKVYSATERRELHQDGVELSFDNNNIVVPCSSGLGSDDYEDNDGVIYTMSSTGEESSSPKNRAFDLPVSLKHNVQEDRTTDAAAATTTAASTTTMQAMAPYPMVSDRETPAGDNYNYYSTSEADNDSWAQTEGTVGSLEGQLEEIMSAEI